MSVVSPAAALHDLGEAVAEGRRETILRFVGHTLCVAMTQLRPSLYESSHR